MEHFVQLGQSSMSMVKEASDTEGRFSLLELNVEPGGTIFGMHLHLDCDETVIGVEGLSAWTIGSELVVVGPGERIVIPRGIPHTMHNRQTYPSRSLCAFSPGCITAEFLIEMSGAYQAVGTERLARIDAALQHFRMLPVPLRH